METEKSNIFHHFFSQLSESYLDDIQLRELLVKQESINKAELINDEEEAILNSSVIVTNIYDKRDQIIESKLNLNEDIDNSVKLKNESKVHALKSYFENLVNNNENQSFSNRNSKKKVLQETANSKQIEQNYELNSNSKETFCETNRCFSKESLSYSDDTITFDSLSSLDSMEESNFEKRSRKKRMNSKDDLKLKDDINTKTDDIKGSPKSNKLHRKTKKKRSSKEELISVPRSRKDSTSKSRKDSASKLTKIDSKESIKKDGVLKSKKESKSRKNSASNKSESKNNTDNFLTKPKLIYTWEIDPREIRFEEKIGEGTSCKVYKGTYRGQVVALKVLKDSNKKQSENFIKEFDIMSQFRSPYVVYFFGGCLEPIATMVLGYYPKGSLYDVLHDPNIELNWGVVIRVALNISKGLDSMHNWKPQLLHRDLKSRNIIVEDDWQIKLCDFGESRFAIYSNEDTLCKVRGTYAYVAPEIYFGHQFTVKSDVYSFGIVLWELCTRCVKNYYEAPYAKYKSLVHDYQIIIQTSKKGLRPEIDERIPSSIAHVIKRCWDQNPNRRPETKDLIEYFEEISKNQDNPTNWKLIGRSKDKKLKSRKLSRQ